MSDHETFMLRCLELAHKGLGRTHPNPMVGAVVVANGKIIGEGFHPASGQPHAEVFAIRSVSEPHLLTKSTLYVNLEPCNHHGKTPPCTELILRSGIPKVVIAQQDPNPLVAGRGIKRLQREGVEVITGVLESEARYLNRRFNTFHEQKRPYIILKWAESKDGFIDIKRTAGDGQSPVRITRGLSHLLVHRWRSEEPAILVGAHTLQLDNPRLNTRDWGGPNPLRIVLTRSPQLLAPGRENNQKLHFFDGTQPTLIFSPQHFLSQTNPEYISLNFSQPVWPQIFNELYQRNILSLLVEGGRYTLQSLIDTHTWDEVRVLKGGTDISAGISAPALSIKFKEETPIGQNIFLFSDHNRIP